MLIGKAALKIFHRSIATEAGRSYIPVVILKLFGRQFVSALYFVWHERRRPLPKFHVLIVVMSS